MLKVGGVQNNIAMVLFVTITIIYSKDSDN